MTLPAQIAVSFDYSSGATFGVNGFVIGDANYGILGTSTLGNSDIVTPIIDLTPNVYQIAIRRGRNIQRDTYEAGTCTVRVLDPDSYFNPQNVSSPYYGYLAPLRKVRVSGTTAEFEYFLFSGYVTDYKYTYPQGEETGYVDIICSDAFRLFQMANISSVTNATAGQDTGTRIDKILDQVGFPTDMRSVSTGLNTCVVDPGTARTSLAAIQNAEFSETGAFYCSPNGRAIFKNRTEVMSSLAADSVQFDQSGTGIPYKQIQFAFDDKLIINEATFTRVGGIAQTSFNQASIDKYFPHSIAQDNLVAETDDIVLNIAQEYVGSRQATTIRIDAITVDCLDPAVPVNTIMALDYFSNLRIINNQPGGSVIDKTLQFQGISWDINPQKMTAVITTLEPIAEAFIVGSATYGIIGESMLGY